MVEAGDEVIIGRRRHDRAGSPHVTVDTRAGRTRVGPFEQWIAGLDARTPDPSHRMDRRDGPMERVPRQLDLADASH